MNRMTIERLEKYYIIANQLEAIKLAYIPSYISAVDTSKVSVQNSKTADMTCDIALNQLEMNPAIQAEYTRLRAELAELNAFIFAIDDELIRAIAINRCCLNQTYEEIGKKLHYSARHCSDLLKKYLRNLSDFA